VWGRGGQLKPALDNYDQFRQSQSVLEMCGLSVSTAHWPLQGSDRGGLQWVDMGPEGRSEGRPESRVYCTKH